jgi:hypothetical protein
VPIPAESLSQTRDVQYVVPGCSPSSADLRASIRAHDGVPG